MQLKISGHHLDITPSLREYVTNKIDRLNKHHDKITTTDVILSIDKLAQKAEARIHVSGADLFADAVAEDMYAAIDGLTDKLDRQLIRHKEKLKAHR